MDRHMQLVLETGRLVQDTSRLWEISCSRYIAETVSKSELSDLRFILIGMYLLKSQKGIMGVSTAEAKEFITREGRSRAHVTRRFGQAIDLGLIEYLPTFDRTDKRMRYVGLSGKGEKLARDFLESASRGFEKRVTSPESVEELAV